MSKFMSWRRQPTSLCAVLLLIITTPRHLSPKFVKRIREDGSASVNGQEPPENTESYIEQHVEKPIDLLSPDIDRCRKIEEYSNIPGYKLNSIKDLLHPPAGSSSSTPNTGRYHCTLLLRRGRDHIRYQPITE